MASFFPLSSRVRLDDDRTCILVIIGADKEGNKELVAVSDGYRESTLSWKELLSLICDVAG